jgi:hypothetical protein
METRVASPRSPPASPCAPNGDVPTSPDPYAAVRREGRHRQPAAGGRRSNLETAIRILSRTHGGTAHAMFKPRCFEHSHVAVASYDSRPGHLVTLA